MKKLICLLLTVTLVISVFMSVMVFSASADVVQIGYTDGAQSVDESCPPEEYSEPCIETNCPPEEPTELDGSSDKSGMIGENVWYKLYDDGTLEIGGKGETYNYKWRSYDSEINDSPFKNRNDIKTIIINDGITNLGSALFYRCDFTSINIPDSMTNIGNYTFSYCEEIEEIDLPETVSSIGSAAFYGCSRLKQMDIPNNVISIKDDTFHHCKRMTEVFLPNTVQSIGENAFRNCEALTMVTLPQSVTMIGASAFCNCFKLSKINIPYGVKEIRPSTFNQTSIKSITVPKSVEIIDTVAFCNCNKLSSICILNPNCRIVDDDSTIWGLGIRAIVYGYKGSKAERYANDYNHIFIAIDDYDCDKNRHCIINVDESDFCIICGAENKSITLGDVDGDEKINTIDTTLIQRKVAEIPVYNFNESAADTDGDGFVTVKDATAVQRYLAQLSYPEGIGIPIG